jgi:hypothetical protein
MLVFKALLKASALTVKNRGDPLLTGRGIRYYPRYNPLEVPPPNNPGLAGVIVDGVIVDGGA